MATTYNNLYLDARSRLRAAGIEGAQLEARELICYAANKTRDEFLRDYTLYVSEQVAHRTGELITLPHYGETVAYIIGECEIYGLGLDISPDVLVPRTDSEVLAARAIALTRAAGDSARMLDLCAGSGCIGLAVATHVPACRVVLADASERAVQLCKRNTRRNDLLGRVTSVHADAKEAPSSALWEFDVIASNPPYIKSGEIAQLERTVRDFEPHMALDGGPDGLDFYRAIAAKWKRALRVGGVIVFEVGMGQAPSVEMILAQHGFGNILTHPDTHGIWRVVEGTAND